MLKLVDIDRSRNLVPQVTERLEDAILLGLLAPGEEVPQLKLAQQFGLSQTAIREALQELERRGLVTQRGRTKTVTDFSEEDLAHLFEVRLSLEPLACRLAATHFTEALGRELEEQLRLMQKSADEQNAREHVRHDLQFHRTIWAGQPNRYLEQHLNQVCASLFAYELVRRTQANYLDFGWNMRQTTMIFRVLRTRDGDLAERVIRRTITRFYRRDTSDYRRIGGVPSGGERGV
ncbi:MAG: GntR family transcriptional regulator [Bryobacteraceae bacterium]|nr:GntR family transcriptional regulator [Bryobacteraceae bacterium]